MRDEAADNALVPVSSNVNRTILPLKSGLQKMGFFSGVLHNQFGELHEESKALDEVKEECFS